MQLTLLAILRVNSQGNIRQLNANQTRKNKLSVKNILQHIVNYYIFSLGIVVIVSLSYAVHDGCTILCMITMNVGGTSKEKSKITLEMKTSVLVLTWGSWSTNSNSINSN